MYVLEYNYVNSSKKKNLSLSNMAENKNGRHFFRLNMTNRHKSHRFVDIKFIFVAICMFLRTTISNMTILYLSFSNIANMAEIQDGRHFQRD